MADPANVTIAATRARQKAIQRLQQEHPEDWERFHGEEREAEGLARMPTPKSLAAENRTLRARLAEFEAGERRLKRAVAEVALDESGGSR